jgi:hypothetical protein
LAIFSGIETDMDWFLVKFKAVWRSHAFPQFLLKGRTAIWQTTMNSLVQEKH